MTRIFYALITLSTLLSIQNLSAFSLAGPRPPWMDEAGTCYSDLTGPMGVDEEYRMNTPIVFYGVTGDFASFFGSRGIEEMRKAVAVLDDLPDADSIVLDDYPVESYRVNHRARALGLVDIKSVALQAILHTMGLEDATAYVYAPRNAWVVNNVVLEYYMTVRNYDPITLLQSPYINGTLYTYNRQGCPFVFPVDPVERIFPRTAPSAANRNSEVSFSQAGLFLTGLTQDDVGGLRYIYHPQNYNMETVVPGTSGGSGAGGFLGGGGGGGPFDFSGITGGGGGGPYDSAVIITNTVAVGGGQGQVGGGLGGGATTNAFINPAVRGGVGKIDFVEANFDSLLGEFFVTQTVQYSDTVVTNGTRISQQLVRTVTSPDILFDARDLQGPHNQGPLPPAFTVQNRAELNWINSDTFDETQGDDDGPGIIGDTVFTFNTVTPWIPGFVDATGAFLNDGSFGAFSSRMWGAFDGTTNDPVIFPLGMQLDDLERLVFSR